MRNHKITELVIDAATAAKLRELSGSSEVLTREDILNSLGHVQQGGNIIKSPLQDVTLPAKGSVEATLAERGARYGQFIDHAKIAQGLQDVMRESPNWVKLDVDMKQALSVIADKIARILNGDAGYTDSWHDIQGYSKLVETRLLTDEKRKAE